MREDPKHSQTNLHNDRSSPADHPMLSLVSRALRISKLSTGRIDRVEIVPCDRQSASCVVWEGGEPDVSVWS